MKHTLTKWGKRVKLFALNHDMTVKELCAAADVKEATLYAAMNGTTPGRRTKIHVERYIAERTAGGGPGALSEQIGRTVYTPRIRIIPARHYRQIKGAAHPKASDPQQQGNHNTDGRGCQQENYMEGRNE